MRISTIGRCLAAVIGITTLVPSTGLAEMPRKAGASDATQAQTASKHPLANCVRAHKRNYRVCPKS